jgi:hypothetical protein
MDFFLTMHICTIIHMSSHYHALNIFELKEYPIAK